MTVQSYTDSALSDKFKEFFSTFKDESKKYYYVDNIDALIIGGTLKINSDHFTEEIKSICSNTDKKRLHVAIYRAIGEVFGVRYGSAGRDEFVRMDKFTFELHGVQYQKPDYIEETEDDALDNTSYEKIYVNKEWPDVAETIGSDESFITIRESNKMWIYSKSKKFYIPDGDTMIKEYTQDSINACTRKSVLEVVETIKRCTYVYADEFFGSGVVNTIDGILNVDTIQVTEHSPDEYSTSKLPFHVQNNSSNYNVKLYNHVLSIIDPADVHLFLELLWMYISMNNPFKKMFIFKGLTNTQKTTLSTIITWIIGPENFSYERPQNFLSSKSRFSTNKFIGKRGNIASEIGNLDEEHIENQKSLVGGERQATERKNDNTPFMFDPTKFTFLYTTNELGKAYSTINDASVIGRYQFMIFRNKLEDDTMNGDWESSFFESGVEKQDCIDTIVKFVLNYKRAQKLGFQKKTRWSTISETKKILEDEITIEDKYFRSNRLVKKRAEKLTLKEIKQDFEEFTGVDITSQALGYILKKNGYKTVQSNGITVLKGFTFVKPENETLV